MTEITTDHPQGPFEGSRCVAGPGGQWGSATIRRVNENGSFKIEFDEKSSVIMPYWHGVTPAEVSFDDVLQWKVVFTRICPNGRSLSETDFTNALSTLGYQLESDQARGLWVAGYQAICNLPGEPAPNYVFDEDSTYRLFLHLGLSAKQCAETPLPDQAKPFFKLYWNQIRMGGRDPAEVMRPVTLEDALAALGLKADRVDQSAVAFLQQVEQDQEIRLPSALTQLSRSDGVARAVMDCHSNNPSLVDFDPDEWKVRRGMREQQPSGEYAIVIMVPHQGDHEWAVVFDEGEEDARVYVRWDTEDGESWLLTAPDVGMFFWDLAQTGLTWYQDTMFDGGKPVRRTDIGLLLNV